MQFASPPPGPSVAAPVRVSVTWEEAPCPLCAARHGTTLIEAQDHQAGPDGLFFAIVQCDSCGCCFTNPRPDPGSIGQFYPSHYAPHGKHHQPRGRRWNPLRVWKQPRVEKRPIPWHGRGRLLDFGCGSGQYLLSMKQLGWSVVGLDTSCRVVDRLRDELGLTAYVGSLPHLDLEPESFDVITMWHALEHVHEPMPVLREARKLLAPGGKIVIAVPNIDSLPFRWFERHWFGLELPRHLTHFTPTSLPAMLQRCGFATEPVQFVRHADWLRHSARRACAARSDVPRWQRALQYRLPALAATWFCYFLQQSDCLLVTGHR